MTTDTATVLRRLESYYDAVPRARASVEESGPFTVFVATTGRPYYARPRLGEPASPTSDDVRRVLDRQAELGVPRSIEWMHEMAPSLLETAKEAGLSVEVCPLLVLHGTPRVGGGLARLLDPDDPADTTDLATVRAAVSVGFANPGTSSGAAGIAERDDVLAIEVAACDEVLLDAMRAGRVRQAAVYDAEAPDFGPVGGGSYIPVDGVAEISGVGVLPAYRRRGLAGQVTQVLARDALDRGVTTVFCSAQSDDVARIYEAVGFRRMATACIAEVPAGDQ
jgi:ribosomal protein S18 acetylase RimI-like enzyme